LSMESDCPYRLIAYHAQQCAEKYLKAYLVFQGVDFPFTHNIARLLELCGEHTDWTGRLAAAEELTPFAITTRYPGMEEEVSKDEGMRAIEIAEEVKDGVREELKQAGWTEA